MAHMLSVSSGGESCAVCSSAHACVRAHPVCTCMRARTSSVHMHACAHILCLLSVCIKFAPGRPLACTGALPFREHAVHVRWHLTMQLRVQLCSCILYAHTHSCSVRVHEVYLFFTSSTYLNDGPSGFPTSNADHKMFLLT